MQTFEYKVVPAPSKGKKGPGVKGPDGKFANALQELMNDLAKDGWEYQRADILPSEERQGLTSSQTVYRSVLVFRKPLQVHETTDPAPLPWETDVTPAVPSVPADRDPQVSLRDPDPLSREEDAQTRL